MGTDASSFGGQFVESITIKLPRQILHPKCHCADGVDTHLAAMSADLPVAGNNPEFRIVFEQFRCHADNNGVGFASRKIGLNAIISIKTTDFIALTAVIDNNSADVLPFAVIHDFFKEKLSRRRRIAQREFLQFPSVEDHVISVYQEKHG